MSQGKSEVVSEDSFERLRLHLSCLLFFIWNYRKIYFSHM